jgi:hypothetical protein
MCLYVFVCVCVCASQDIHKLFCMNLLILLKHLQVIPSYCDENIISFSTNLCICEVTKFIMCKCSEIKGSAELTTHEIIIHFLISTYASMRICNTYFLYYTLSELCNSILVDD